MPISTSTPNRLINETSPYLLQHAYNPVDWWPWSEEAFLKAKAEDKPVFLSVGYSTCHWCHVMERESFEDAEVAEVLNRSFIAVKVDREERPDVDAVYMQITQALTGSGGWPMTVLLTPDKNAFFAGTYFPKHTRHGVAGLLELLREAEHKWRTSRARLETLGDELARFLNAPHNAGRPALADPPQVRAYNYFRNVFDAENGGFGPAPKFPSPHNLMFLMRYGVFESEPRATFMAERTLTQMYRGGLFDHIGYGFSRYSTDGRWLVPHFEKMLYDNALLTIAYLDAYQLTKKPLYLSVAEKTLKFIAREMTGEQGEFYSAQDADSEGHEGRFYVWTPGEITSLLGGDDGKRFCEYFSVTQRGNFEGKNILNLLNNPGFDAPDARIESLIHTVYNHRQTRVRPHTDDKALTSWNAMMIAAYAKAYSTLGAEEYLSAATRAEAFIREKLTDETGALRVSYRDGAAKGSGYLDDYAFYTIALLALYNATFDASYLEAAVLRAEMMCESFEAPDGGFYMYSEDAERLIARPKETYDGAVPSGNSAAAYALCELAALTGEPKWETRAARQTDFFDTVWHGHPSAFCFALMAEARLSRPPLTLICAAASDGDASRLRETLSKRFAPELSAIVITDENKARLTRLIPSLGAYRTANGETAFYLCENRTCSAPITGFDTLEHRLAILLTGRGCCKMNFEK